MLEHSVKTYGPLPSELRSRRTRARTLSRPSPYPPTQIYASPDDSRVLISETSRPSDIIKRALEEVTLNPNMSASAMSSLDTKSFSLFDDGNKKSPISDLQSRPRVASSSRRNALGWSKRNTGKASTGPDKKENTGLVTSMVLT
jgi:serine/arginine repetitive matrix protein 2